MGDGIFVSFIAVVFLGLAFFAGDLNRSESVIADCRRIGATIVYDRKLICELEEAIGMKAEDCLMVDRTKAGMRDYGSAMASSTIAYRSDRT